MKFAVETVPVVAGSVTPPEAALIPAFDNTTVPGVALTAMLPKFILPAVAIAIGVMIVAEPVAVPVTCAFAVADNATKTTAAMIVIKFFIVLSFFFVLSFDCKVFVIFISITNTVPKIYPDWVT